LQKVYIGHPDRGTSCVVNMKYTRFEKARIIGSRALQISYGAPVLVEYSEKLIDPIDIAMLEYDKDMIPITVVRN
jgi:DNA-directed RNA polymerase subunit K